MPDPLDSPSLASQVYGYLADDEDARVCKEIPAAACDEQPRSFLFQLIANALTKIGDSLASPKLVLARCCLRPLPRITAHVSHARPVLSTWPRAATARNTLQSATP